MTKELSTEKLEAKDYGIDKKQEQDLMSNLPQIKAERDVLIPQYDSVMKMDIEDPDTSVQAKRVRGMIQKNRTQGINVWHRNAKDFFLKGGQFCDAIKRREVDVNNRMEENLLLIEKHQEIKLEKAKKELQQEREGLISNYIEGADLMDLASMDQDVFAAYLSTKKKAHEDKIKAELEAQKEREKAAKAQKEEDERLRKERDRLKAEAEERERLDKIEADKRDKKERREKARNAAATNRVSMLVEIGVACSFEDCKKMTEKEWNEFFSVKNNQYQAEQNKILADKLKKEEEDKKKDDELKKANAELQAKKEAEQKEAEEKERLIQLELNASDEDKVKSLISDLEKIKSWYVFKSKANKQMFLSVCDGITKIVNDIPNE